MPFFIWPQALSAIFEQIVLNMKKLFWSLAVLCAFNTYAQVDLINKVKDNQGAGADAYQFKEVINVEAGPVSDQGRSSTCWSFSTVSFLETEYLRQNKKFIDLSELYVVRKTYELKAEKYIRMHGRINFAQGGALPDALMVLQSFGALPQAVYSGLPTGQTQINHDELETALKAVLDAVLKNEGKTISNTWKTSVNALLDAYMGAVPNEFNWEGKKYSPRSFADQVLKISASDYIQITSFTHQPYYTSMFIEVPDNWMWGTAYNLPLNDLMECVNHALSQNHSLAWATDVSEKGFNIRKGLAVNPDRQAAAALGLDDIFLPGFPELQVDEALRQKSFDNWETTDDHGMQITGISEDQNGKRFYLVKNSWGELENPFYKNGYLYASESFVKHKTISFVLHKKALPKAIARQLGL